MYLCFYIWRYICIYKWAMPFPDSYFIKHVDWSASLWYLSVPVFLVHNAARTAAGNMCVLDCLNPYAQHPSLPFTISPPQSQTWMADSPLCLGVHSVSAILHFCWSPSAQWWHMSTRPACLRWKWIPSQQKHHTHSPLLSVLLHNSISASYSGVAW